MAPKPIPTMTFPPGKEKTEVFSGVMPLLKMGQTYNNARIGFSAHNGQFCFILENKHTDQAIQEWTDYYLSANINYLRMTELLPNLTVMVVNKEEGTVTRGRVLEEVGDQMIKVYCVDEGRIVLVYPQQLYVTTVVAASIEWKNVAVVLDRMKFFNDTPMMAKALKGLEEVIENRDLSLQCTGFDRINGIRVPTVKVIISGPNGPVNYNQELLRECVDQCCVEILPGSSAHGYVSHAEEDGLVSIQLSNGLVDMLQGKLEKFSMEDLREQFVLVDAGNVCLDEEHYLAVYDEDDLIYRAKVLEVVKKDGVDMARVEFIDFGNKSIVPFDKMCHAGSVDVAFEVIPPMAVKGYLRWIEKLLNVDQFLSDVEEAVFTIVAHRSMTRNGFPVFQLNKEGGLEYNKHLVRERLAIKREKTADE